MSEMQYWLWLTLKKGIASRKITALLEHFGTPEEIFCASEAAFSEVSGLSRADVHALCDRDLTAAERIMADCRRKGIKILTFDSPYYPRLLARIYDPPYVLYARYRERIDLNEHMTLAIVGTRQCSSYGAQMAESVARNLAKEGVTVVSGMAKGIDGAANAGALRGGGKTVAVLGCGVDVCYPPEHKELMQAIIDNGMVLSEYPPGTLPLSSHFKPRNRIITGLSNGTVIVEAPARSGAINSASWTAEQGREIFIVPGDATRYTAQGSNKLMLEGAKPVLNAEDILCEFREGFRDILEKNRPVGERTVELPTAAPEPVRKAREKRPKRALPKPLEKLVVRRKKPLDLSRSEKSVLKLLSEQPIHIDQLAGQGLTTGEIAAALTLLELKGLVTALPGKQYCLKQEQ